VHGPGWVTNETKAAGREWNEAMARRVAGGHCGVGAGEDFLMRALLRVKRGRHVTVASVVSVSMGVHLVLVFFCFCDYDTTSYAIGAWNLSWAPEPEAQWHADAANSEFAPPGLYLSQ
jgi:hypothetical protein